MGIEHNCSDQVEIKNGTFDNADDWTINAHWVIAGGVANTTWIVPKVGMFMLQLISILEGHTYRIEVDVNTADFQPGAALYFRLGGVPGENSDPITTPGHKDFTIYAGGNRTQLTIFIDDAQQFPGECEIDNVAITDLGLDITCELNMQTAQDNNARNYPRPDDDFTQILSSSFDNTNCLIHYEPP